METTQERRVGERRVSDRRKAAEWATLRHLQGWRMCFILATLLLIIAGCLYYAYAYPEYEAARVREKALDRQQEVNLLSGIADLLAEHDGTAGGIGYEEVLTYSLRYMEAEFTSTFAQLYDEALNPLLELSPGVAGGAKHNPLDYPEFVAAVRGSEFGSLTYWYETEEAGGRDVYMTYRWVPTDATRTDRLLIAVAISKYSVSERIATNIKTCTLAMVVVASIAMVGAAFIACNPRNAPAFPDDWLGSPGGARPWRPAKREKPSQC